MQTLLIRRSRLEVLTEILRICKTPQAKTRLMQKANLSYNTLQDCLQQLQELGMVNIFPDSSEYMTTQKGSTFLQKWAQLQEFLMPKEKIQIKTKRFFPKL
jgi:predicted transcriptional regulator